MHQSKERTAFEGGQSFPKDDKIVHTHTLPRRPRPVLSKDIHSHFLPFELWNWVEFTNDKQTIVNVAIALLLSSGLLVCLPALA